MKSKKHKVNAPKKKASFGMFGRICAIIENARGNMVRAVNTEMVSAYWLIGGEIVREEQQGASRAEYGKRIIEKLAGQLKQKYGAGWSSSHLRNRTRNSPRGNSVCHSGRDVLSRMAGVFIAISECRRTRNPGWRLKC